MQLDKILKFILDHLKAGSIDLVFNEDTLDEPSQIYALDPFGIKVSVEMLEDIKANPTHYQQILSDDKGKV